MSLVVEGLNVNKKRRTKNKPLTKDEKTIWLSSLFVSMLFLVGNFDMQQSLLDVLLLLLFVLSLLFLPLFVYRKLYIT